MHGRSAAQTWLEYHPTTVNNLSVDGSWDTPRVPEWHVLGNPLLCSNQGKRSVEYRRMVDSSLSKHLYFKYDFAFFNAQVLRFHFFLWNMNFASDFSLRFLMGETNETLAEWLNINAGSSHSLVSSWNNLMTNISAFRCYLSKPEISLPYVTLSVKTQLKSILLWFTVFYIKSYFIR